MAIAWFTVLLAAGVACVGLGATAGWLAQAASNKGRKTIDRLDAVWRCMVCSYACLLYTSAIALFEKASKPGQVAAIDAMVAYLGQLRCLNAGEHYARLLQAADAASAFADRHQLPAQWDGRAVLLSMKATAQRNLGDAPGALVSFQQAIAIMVQIVGTDSPALSRIHI